MAWRSGGEQAKQEAGFANLTTVLIISMLGIYAALLVQFGNVVKPLLVQLTPYAHAELLYDLNQREWTRLRYSAGAAWNITKRIVLEGYYLRQNTWASVPQFVNATGLAMQFYLR